MSISYEVRVWNTSLLPLAVRAYVPSLFATFSLLNGSSLTFYVSPRNFSLTNLNWTSPALAEATKSIVVPTNFSSTPAKLSSQLLAVMITAPRGTIMLALRWQWNVTFVSNGTTITSPWSPVTTTGHDPTIFYPAPYVQLVSKTNQTVLIGGFFTAMLSGAIASTQFKSELEYGSNGFVIHANHTNTGSSNATPVAVTIQIEANNASLGVAKLLDHIHDDCGSMLYSISLVSAYAARASVTLSSSPASCGPISFNGTAYGQSSSAVVVPSAASISIDALACTGHSFARWSYGSGVYVSSSSSASASAVVSANGTLTADYT